MAKRSFFFHVRVLLLLIVLLMVAAGTWIGQMRSLSWDEPLWVNIHLINGDDLQSTQDYIEAIEESDFDEIDEFMAAEAQSFGVPIDQPVQVQLVGQIESIPPEPPYGGNMVQIALWSLKLRWWAWRNERGGPAQIRMFVLYFDPAENPRLAHSLGLQKGRIGVVNAFAAKRMHRTNNFVIVHEMLHTLGASDKYDPGTNYPLFPAGFAEPSREPLLPQRWAEVMGGRIPTDRNAAQMPRSLDETIVGDSTALELRWIE